MVIVFFICTSSITCFVRIITLSIIICVVAFGYKDTSVSESCKAVNSLELKSGSVSAMAFTGVIFSTSNGRRPIRYVHVFK